MIKYNYTKDGLIQFFDKHSEESSTNGFIRDAEKIKTLIDSGVEIAPYVEPVKTLYDIRQERDLLLAANVDIYNPIRWAELSTEKKNQVKTYRQALLDITKQDPTSVIWPEVPLV
tara:strand:- start:445 stop:789 length:345 start_codon:yes stop_codon:yes gene_type:complete